MKKILVGCLVVLVIALVGFGVAGFYAYRWAKPMIQSTGDYLDRARAMARLSDAVNNQSAYTPPANGELTQAQVDRFVAVQTRVRDELGARWTEIETKSAQIGARSRENNGQLALSEMASVFSDLSGIYMDARRAQVNALNVHKFSDAEYTWVRRRVYEAAGVEIAGSIDLSKLEQMAREGTQNPSLSLPDMPKPPRNNLALVKPHMAKVKEWVPMAVLGL
jgi:uncharacterized protein YxeA